MTDRSFYENRQEISQKILDSHHLDGILFGSLENIRYLCGFTGSDGALVLARKESFFLTDSRYWTQADEEVKGSQIVHYKKKMEGIFSLLSDLRLKRIGFESAALSFSAFQFLSEKLGAGAKLVPLEDEIKNLRAVKDAHELTLIRKAIDISSNAFFHVTEILKEGVVEREVALEMECFMKRAGADALGFDIIIASGKRSALPHGKASGKRIEKGDFILIDFGSGFQGYHSDQTRTVICGSPSSEQQKVYQIVKEAHDKAMEKVRPGIPAGEVDGAARDHIRNKGYGEYFGHGTGHGIGLAVHEDPAINSENKGPVQEGMVFTIEPGIYLPDRGGVRIEDMVLVTAHGAEALTYLPTEMKVI
ncbi:MAG TPA: Xaa-Pro peptidase family protein [Thermodesulfobacteriota bacterium]|nr:Xaa-Pro peptidase family protein [Thermodesulfobacteriota bacterium]